MTIAKSISNNPNQKELKHGYHYSKVSHHQFQMLKQINLQDYSMVQRYVRHPRFIPLRQKTLNQALVRAQIKPTDDQLLDLDITFGIPSSNHVTAGTLPQLRSKGILVKKCGHPRCATCQHLQCQPSFKSTKTSLIQLDITSRATQRTLFIS